MERIRSRGVDCCIATRFGLRGGTRVLFKCPHCKSKTQLRTSKEINVLMRELIYMCLEPECGHTFVAYLEAARTLSPSAMPDPWVYLPMSEHVRRKMATHPTLKDKWRDPSITQPIQDASDKPTPPTHKRRAPAPVLSLAPDPILAALHPGLRPTVTDHG